MMQDKKQGQDQISKKSFDEFCNQLRETYKDYNLVQSVSGGRINKIYNNGNKVMLVTQNGKAAQGFKTKVSELFSKSSESGGNWILSQNPSNIFLAII